MWRTIKKGKHNNFSIPRIHFGKTSETYEVMFDESCRYDLQGVDQLDWNKLFGWSYGLHHNNSIRVGWRYNIEKDVIELSCYTYRDGIRKSVLIGNTKINKNTRIDMFEYQEHILIIIDSFWYHEELRFNKSWGYNLKPYFGGNSVAPHDIRIWLKKV